MCASSTWILIEMECMVQQNPQRVKHCRRSVTWVEKLLKNNVPQCEVDLNRTWAQLLDFARTGGKYQHRAAHVEKEVLREDSWWNLMKRSEGMWPKRQKLQWVYTNVRPLVQRSMWSMTNQHMWIFELQFMYNTCLLFLVWSNLLAHPHPSPPNLVRVLAKPKAWQVPASGSQCWKRSFAWGQLMELNVM